MISGLRNLRRAAVFTIPVPMLTKTKLLPLLALLPCLVPAAPAAAQDTPTKQALYADGPDNRYLLGGEWLFRPDPGKQGLTQRFHRQTSTEGWTGVGVPHAWNVGDHSPESMRGGVGWYRKDFRLPSSSGRFDWTLRFESVNYRLRAWLNGREIGRHRGAYLPFELRIPRSALRRGGTNRLVVRIDSVRRTFDLPPSGLTRTSVPTGGWWNYGGILREVYLKQVDRVDFRSVQVLPVLPCRSCPATVRFRVRARNHASTAQRVSLSGRFGGRPVRFSSRTIRPGRSGTFRGSIRVSDPRLWSPRHPTLYSVSLDLRANGRRVVRHTLKSGIRSVKVSRGRLTLNGLPVNIRGVSIHEDDLQKGSAIDNAIREQFVRDAKDVGATMLRSHYPLHPHLHELADREGLLVWSEIPMYAMKTDRLKLESAKRMGVRQMRENVLANGSHPSVVTWSVGNELSARPGPTQGDYLERAARAAKRLDPTRPISYAVAGYPGAGCQDEYAPLDIIGINEYFGWYPGPNGQIADRTRLSEYLDSVRACYRDKAIMITEFGAEANRSGPVEEKGTYEFQQDFVNYHLGVYAQKAWLSGALYWTLKEFRVRPEWEGGNPRPEPPIHQKAVIGFGGQRKPAFSDLQRIYRATDQYPGDPAP